MAKIKVQKITQDSGLSKRELYATVCFYYPQYTLKEVSQLPARDVNLLLKVAQKQQAGQMFNFTNIAAGPHTNKGKGSKSLSEHFKKLANKKI